MPKPKTKKEVVLVVKITTHVAKSPRDVAVDVRGVLARAGFGVRVTAQKEGE